jgi:hypothetical protein
MENSNSQTCCSSRKFNNLCLCLYNTYTLPIHYLIYVHAESIESSHYLLLYTLSSSFRLAETPLSKWFDSSDIQHTTSFVNMIDMLVHILSPTEFDIISQELFSLGKRHAQSSKDLIQMFHPSIFLHFSNCFCQTLMHFLNVKKNGHFRDVGNLEAIQDAWEYLLSYIRIQMEQGAQSEHCRRLSLIEKRTRLLSSSSSLVSPRSKKIKQESFKRTKPLPMRSFTSSHRDHSTVSSHQSKEHLSSSSPTSTSKLVSPRRILSRFASFHGLTKVSRSAPSRTASSGHQKRELLSRDKVDIRWHLPASYTLYTTHMHSRAIHPPIQLKMMYHAAAALRSTLIFSFPQKALHIFTF